MSTERFKKLAIHLVLAIGSIVMLYPLVFSLMGSVTNTEDYLRSTWIPIPSSIYLNNYQAMFSVEMLPTLSPVRSQLHCYLLGLPDQAK